MKTMLAAVTTLFFVLVALPSATHAGKIEIDGNWYTFEQIFSEHGINATRVPAGTRYTGKETPLWQNKRVRVLMVPGRNRYWGTNHYLSERFWMFDEITLSVNTDLGTTVKYELAAPTKGKNGSYNFELNAYGAYTEESNLKVLEVARVFVDAVREYRENMKTIPCIEVSGTLTWFGRFNKSQPSDSKYTYTLIVDSVRVVNKIPNQIFPDSPNLTLEQATEQCLSK